MSNKIDNLILADISYAVWYSCAMCLHLTVWDTASKSLFNNNGIVLRLVNIRPVSADLIRIHIMNKLKKL